MVMRDHVPTAHSFRSRGANASGLWTLESGCSMFRCSISPSGSGPVCLNRRGITEPRSRSSVSEAGFPVLVGFGNAREKGGGARGLWDRVLTLEMGDFIFQRVAGSNTVWSLCGSPSGWPSGPGRDADVRVGGGRFLVFSDSFEADRARCSLLWSGSK